MAIFVVLVFFVLLLWALKDAFDNDDDWPSGGVASA